MDLSWKLILYQAANFIILMVVLTYLFNKFIRPMMHKRAADIQKSLDDIERQKKDMDALKQDYVEHMKEMRAKGKAEIDKATEEGNRIRDEIVTKSEKESVAILERAKKDIDIEKQKAIIEIQKEVASLSILATKQLIHKQLDEETNKKMVEEFLEGLSKDVGKKQ